MTHRVDSHLMTANSVPMRLLAVAMLAVLALPYSAPALCEAVGGMGAGMSVSMDSPVGVHAPDSGMNLCAIDACGVSHVAPLTYGLNVSRPLPIAKDEWSALRTVHEIVAVMPPIPPPEA